MLASEEFVIKYGLQNQAVEIVGMAMVILFDEFHAPIYARIREAAVRVEWLPNVCLSLGCVGRLPNRTHLSPHRSGPSCSCHLTVVRIRSLARRRRT